MTHLMSFYRYDQDSDVHIVDCGGKVTPEAGLVRLQVLDHELKVRQPRDGITKLLIDFRNTAGAAQERPALLESVTILTAHVERTWIPRG